jgi:hypothetical protein
MRLGLPKHSPAASALRAQASIPARALICCVARLQTLLPTTVRSRVRLHRISQSSQHAKRHGRHMRDTWLRSLLVATPVDLRTHHCATSGIMPASAPSLLTTSGRDSPKRLPREGARSAPEPASARCGVHCAFVCGGPSSSTLCNCRVFMCWCAIIRGQAGKMLYGGLTGFADPRSKRRLRTRRSTR